MTLLLCESLAKGNEPELSDVNGGLQNGVSQLPVLTGESRSVGQISATR